jgi:hypothetical protein
MRSALIVSSLILTAAIFACANGVDTAGTGDTGDGTGGTDTDSGTLPTDGSDSGNGWTPPSKEGGTASGKDSGTTTSVDSGTTASADGGTTNTGANDDCTGTTGQQLNASYSSECVNYNFGACTSGNGDCVQAAKDNMTPGPLCCFHPKSGSVCDIAYGTSCVPQ